MGPARLPKHSVVSHWSSQVAVAGHRRRPRTPTWAARAASPQNKHSDVSKTRVYEYNALEYEFELNIRLRAQSIISSYLATFAVSRRHAAASSSFVVLIVVVVVTFQASSRSDTDMHSPCPRIPRPPTIGRGRPSIIMNYDGFDEASWIDGRWMVDAAAAKWRAKIQIQIIWIRSFLFLDLSHSQIVFRINREINFPPKMWHSTDDI